MEEIPNYVALFKDHIPSLEHNINSAEFRGQCPFNTCKGQVRASFSVNGLNGMYKCFRCNASGNAVDFAKYFQVDPRPFYDYTDTSQDLDLDRLNDYHQIILQETQHWRPTYTSEALRALKIGWHPGYKTEVFPIFNTLGEIINRIIHKKYQIKGAKICLYPLNLLAKYDPTYLIICEGLPDVISGLSAHLQCVCSTGGSTALPVDLTDLGRFYCIYICLDNDEAGERGTAMWIKRLRNEFPHIRLRTCDLSDFVDERGDLTAYLSLPGKNRISFINDILRRSRVSTLYSDLPNFIRDMILSTEYQTLSIGDQAVYMQLAMRVTRYRSPLINYRGKSLRVPPGGYWLTLERLNGWCPHYTQKQIRTCLIRLVERGFITKENLNWRRGLLITLNGWSEYLDGHNDGHTKPWSQFDPVFPFPPSILSSTSVSNGGH